MPVGGEGNENGEGDGGEEGESDGVVSIGGVDGGRCMLKAVIGARKGADGAGVSILSWYV
jgi:hypothetical protein